MKKIMAIAIGILLCIALAVPFFAESQGIIPSDGMKVLFEDDFSDTLDTSKWAVREAVSTSDGVMVLGEGGSWAVEASQCGVAVVVSATMPLISTSLAIKEIATTA